MRTLTRSLALLVAGITGIVTALVVPSRSSLSRGFQPSTHLPCAIHRCKSGDVSTLLKSFLESLETARNTSVALRESALAIRNSSLAIRDTFLALRDPLALSDGSHSTTTITVTTPLVTSTMSFNPSLTPSDGTTYHFFTTIPWGSDGSPSSTGNAATIMSSGASVATITSQESKLSTKPPPSITSTISLVTISNTSTTAITPTSNISTSATLSNSVAPYCNGTCPTAYNSVVTSFSLTTVDASIDPNSYATTTSTDLSETPTGSSTGFVQKSGENHKYGKFKTGVALAVGLVLNTIFFLFL